jgi:hypothetical protein
LTRKNNLFILIIVIIIKQGATMQEQNVKICKGPGCKAWSSDRIARELLEIREALDLDGVKICRVPCMKVCGGGTSVRFNSNSKIVKLKESDEVLAVLGIREAGAVACSA